MVTTDDARILAKLLPTRIADSRISGRANNLSALLAPLLFFELWRSLTLFEAIMPVSDPEENPEKISNATNKRSKYINESTA